MENSNHLRTRMQQRGISNEEVEIVRTYGKRSYTTKGVSFAMDRESHRRAMRGLGESKYRHLASKLNIYVICSSDGAIGITAAHRYRKRRR